MGEVNVCLFGTPRINQDRQPLIIGRRKALALFCYLAATRHAHSRESLATLLSPEADAARAHAYLRNSIWVLRRQMGVDRLVTDHESVGLRFTPDLWVDLIEFRRLLNLAVRMNGENPRAPEIAGTLEQAVALHRDRFMAGFDLHDNYAFEEWQLQQQDACQAALCKALRQLVLIHEREADFEKAIEHGRHWLSLDPLDESVQRVLMSLLARAGQRAAALELFAKSTHLLKEDLGLRPAAETLALCRQIAEGVLAPRAPSASQRPRPSRAGGRQRRPSRPARLLAPRTPFVGRGPELERIDRAFDQALQRQLTLVGPGGSGKSRLALEVARRRRPSYPDGVVFVPLAPVREPQFIVAAIVEALNTPFPQHTGPLPAGQSVAERQRALLADHLAEQQMLLVLDNMEHLLGGADIISEILARAPRLHVLVTSRERCHLQGETVIDLAGLPYPGPDVPRARTLDFGAVELFLQGARRARSGFEPRAEDLDAVAHICRIVEGNPLAIELASSWVRILSCSEIAREIAAGLDFLTAREIDVPRRHRSLRAIFEHSWELLSAAEQQAFRRLPVFAGGFDREAAQAVAGMSLAVLTALADKSLVRQRADGRFEIHEVLRQYAAEQLGKEAQEERRAHDDLARHYLGRLSAQAATLQGPQQKAGLAALAEDVENIRSAWLWAASRGWTARLRSAYLGLFLFYDMRSRFVEGAEMCRETISRLTASGACADPQLLALLRGAEAWFLRYQCPARSIGLFNRSLEIFAPDVRTWDRAFVTLLAYNAGPAWQPGFAHMTSEEILEVFEGAGDRWGAALALDVLAFATPRNQRGLALQRAHESLRIRRQLGDLWGMAFSFYVLGRIAEDAHLPHVARRQFRESIRLRKRMGADLDGIVACLLRIGHVDRSQGRFRDAGHTYRQCWLYSRRTGSRLRQTYALFKMGLVAYELGRHHRARRALEAALVIAEPLDFAPAVATIRGLSANVAVATDQPAEAELHLAAIPAACDEANSHTGPREFYEEENPARLLNPWPSLARGRLDLAAGRTEQARTHLGTALAIALRDRDDPTALEALAELARLREAVHAPGSAADLWKQLAAHPAAGWLVQRHCAARARETMAEHGTHGENGTMAQRGTMAERETMAEAETAAPSPGDSATLRPSGAPPRVEELADAFLSRSEGAPD